MVADRFTKALLLVIATCLVILCARNLSEPTKTVHGAITPLQFSADKDRLYFFNPAEQKVWAYPTNGGHPVSAVQLDQLGGELRPVPTYDR